MLSLRFQNPSPLPTGGRLRELDELKGWAILLVIFYHNAGNFGAPSWLHAEVGVDVFLLISGFTLARSSEHSRAGEFIRRRVWRIFPAYWLALGMFVALRSHFYKVSTSPLNFALHVAGLHDFGPPAFFSDINDSFWFISLILSLYVAFLFVRHRLADFGFIIGVGAILTAIACLAYGGAQHGGGIIQFAVRIPSFFIGLLIGRASAPGEFHLSVNPWLAVGLLAVTYTGWLRAIIPFYAVAGVAMAAGFLVVRQSLAKHPDGRVVLSALAGLGVYSYEIFLFHQPLMRDYNRMFWARCFDVNEPSKGQLAAGMVAGFVLTLIISVVVHKGAERMFARKLRSAPLAA